MDSFLGLHTILGWVDEATRDYTHATYQALSDALAPTLKLLMLAYIGLFGLAHITGRAQFDLWRTARHFLLMAMITAFVTRWDFFALYFGHLFTDGPARLMTLVSGGNHNPNELLENVLDRGILAANAINQMAGLSTLGFLIVGYSVFYMTLFCVSYALFLIVLSKCALAILLGLAPLFFLFLFFEHTREFFTHYLRQVLNFALIPLITAAVLGIMLRVPQQALIQLQRVLDSHSGHGGRECVFVLLSFLILLGLLHQVTGFAAGLSGGGLQLNPGSSAGWMSAGLIMAARGAAQRPAKMLSRYGRRQWLAMKNRISR
jgi:type IV secretion system protein VirB6